MSSRVALIVLAVILAVICFNTLRSPDLWYVDENGETHKGITAARQIKELKENEAGMLTTDRIAEVIGENRDIVSSPEYNSSDITQQDIAFSRGQGISDIKDVITMSFCGFGEYDYYRANSLEPSDMPLQSQSTQASCWAVWEPAEETVRYRATGDSGRACTT